MKVLFVVWWRLTTQLIGAQKLNQEQSVWHQRIAEIRCSDQ